MPLLIAIIVIPLIIWLFYVVARTSRSDIIQFFKALALLCLGAGILMLLIRGQVVAFFVALVLMFGAAPFLKKWFLGTTGYPRLDTPLTRDQALAILGLRGNPTKTAIQKAHAKLMQKIHPDVGGNDYLACQLNAARDFLLKNQEE